MPVCESLKIIKKEVTSLFKNSIIYKLLSTSWFLGWLVSVPTPETKVAVNSDLALPNNAKDSMGTEEALPLVYRLMEALLGVLYRIGDTMRNVSKGSIVINNFFALIGILISFYLIFDLATNEYGRLRMLIQAFLALGSLLMPLHKFIPGLWQGSRILSFFSWWGRTD